jgi:hypothetical protein
MLYSHYRNPFRVTEQPDPQILTEIEGPLALSNMPPSKYSLEDIERNCDALQDWWNTPVETFPETVERLANEAVALGVLEAPDGN